MIDICETDAHFLVLVRPGSPGQAILSSTQHITKSKDYKVFHPWLRTGLLTSTGAKWKARRRLITPSFHFKMLEHFLPVFNRNAGVLANKLARHADSGQPVDITHYVHLCAMDTIFGMIKCS